MLQVSFNASTDPRMYPMSAQQRCMDLQVLDDHLKERQWLAAGQYTIADIANFTWVRLLDCPCMWVFWRQGPVVFQGLGVDYVLCFAGRTISTFPMNRLQG